MKNLRLKNVLILFTCLVMLGFVFTSCEEEDILTPITQTSGGASDNNNSNDNVTETRCTLTKIGNGWVSPDGVNYNEEAELQLPNNFYMSGIGLSVNNDNLRTIVVKGRELKEDCTFGPVTEFRGGPASSSTPEMATYFANGIVITGVGFSVRNDNVSALKVNFRAIIIDSNGEYMLGNEVTDIKGSDNIEKFLSSASSSSSIDFEKAVIHEISGVVHNDNAFELELGFSEFDVN